MTSTPIWLLDDEDVVRSESGVLPFLSDKTFVVEDLRYQAHCKLGRPADTLFQQGMKCQALKLGMKKWVSGTVRFVLEFEPDEPLEAVTVDIPLLQEAAENSDVVSEESPLDEILRVAESEAES